MEVGGADDIGVDALCTTGTIGDVAVDVVVDVDVGLLPINEVTRSSISCRF